MGDYLFELIDENGMKEFKDLLYEEELWSKTLSPTKIIVVSIFEDTAAYLYDWLDSKKLRKKKCSAIS